MGEVQVLSLMVDWTCNAREVEQTDDVDGTEGDGSDSSDDTVDAAKLCQQFKDKLEEAKTRAEMWNALGNALCLIV